MVEPNENSWVSSPKPILVETARSKAALVINPASLKALYRCVSTAFEASGAAPAKIQVGVRRSGQSRKAILIEELAADRNPPGEAIEAVSMQWKSGDQEAHISIAPNDETVVASAAMHSVDVAKAFRADVEKEIRNIRAFISPLRETWIDFTQSRAPLVLAMVGVGLIVLLALSSFLLSGGTDFSQAYQGSGERTQDSKPKARPPGYKPKPAPPVLENEGDGWSMPSGNVVFAQLKAFFRGVLGVLVIIVLWCALSWAIGHLFPTIVFDIGEGHDRYENVKRWRWYFLAATGAFSGIVWLASWALSLPFQK